MKKWPFSFRSALAFMHDIAVAIFAWFSAFLLRFNFNIPLEQMALMKSTIIMVFVLEAITSISFGLYRGTWRFASLTDLKRILLSVFTSSAILVSMLFVMNTEPNVPRSILILNPILLILMMSGSRIIYRAFKEHQIYGINFKQGKPVFIIGAGTTAISLIRDLSQSSEWQVIGMLDNDKSMHGREILGLKVFGPIELLSKMQEQFKFRHAIIALPQASHEEKRFILNLANKIKRDIVSTNRICGLGRGTAVPRS
jgi:FlaA1/EpsC-like NDP-sugar epimerase